ncbi:MAG: single-stranded DNA-binding protein [Actinomycetota bacterium]
MSNETHITIRGNLGAQPVLHTGASGGKVARFDVAVAVARYLRETETTDVRPPQWFAVKAFGQLGENVCESANKGTPVIVRGELVTEYWTDAANQQHSRQVVRADSVGIDLRTGTARYMKVLRNSPEAETADSAPPRDAVDVSGAVELQDDEPAPYAVVGETPPF